MISIDEAVAAVRRELPVPRRESLALADASGRILAGDFRASEPSPGFDNSAMDGFAVIWDDVCGADDDDPVTLKIIGESRAGVPFVGAVERGGAIRISTGAMVPDGTDTVIRVEDTETVVDRVRVFAARKKGQDVRYGGEEYRCGDMLIEKCRHLSARHLALLAAAGAGEVEVYVRPRVAVLVTGSELTSVGEKAGPGQIRDSNRLMLTAAVVEAGGEVVYGGRVGDDLDATIAAVEAAEAAGPDIIICAGGVSVGPHDHVKEGAARAGFSEVFWRVRQKPGKPLFFAGKGETLLFGLPGNPVSAYICFCHYLRPALAVIGGGSWNHEMVGAVCAETIENRGKRPALVRVSMDNDEGGETVVYSIGHQGSHMLTSIVAADGYVHLAPGQALTAGDEVEVFLF